MADIDRFKPRAELDAEANLQSFIHACRNQLTVFGASLPFVENVWDVSGFIRLRGKPKRRRIYFYLEPPGRLRQGEAFREPYLSFAKAYLRHEFAHRDESFIGRAIKTLRVLYSAMTEHDSAVKPTEITSVILDRSVQLLEGLSRSNRGLIAYELQKLAAFVVRNHLVTVPFDWKSPVRLGVRHSVRVGKEFDELRAKMLPSTEALAALAHIFRQATEPADVLVSSIMAMLCAAPSRISEILLLPVDSEVVRNDSRGVPVYSLRWCPAKGAPPQLKTVITSMADVVREALEKIRALTKPARAVAAWYERHPALLYLPPSLEAFRERPVLSIEEVGEIVFATAPSRHQGIYQWLRCNKINSQLPPNRRGLGATYAFADIEAAILRKLPRGFPWVHRETGLKYSEALFCHLRGLRCASKPLYRGAVELMGASDIKNSVSDRRNSIFDRFGYVEKDGSPIRVRTHQLRHYLNTLAQAGGLSQLDIALWSGRANIRQNAVYDHVSDKDALAILDDNTRDDKHVLPTLAETRKAVLIRRDEFERLQVKTAHTTEFGFCVHDFAMLPCQLHMDCLNCDEHLCVKGDRTRNESLRRWREETQGLLAHSKTAQTEGVEGADRWTQHQTRTLTRVEQILEVYDDLTVPNGAVIQPAWGSVASWIMQGREERRLLEYQKPVQENSPRLQVPKSRLKRKKRR
jgi:hypothetical protein